MHFVKIVFFHFQGLHIRYDKLQCVLGHTSFSTYGLHRLVTHGLSHWLEIEFQ